jgi:hypothetical protein
VVAVSSNSLGRINSSGEPLCEDTSYNTSLPSTETLKTIDSPSGLQVPPLIAFPGEGQISWLAAPWSELGHPHRPDPNPLHGVLKGNGWCVLGH